MRFKRIILILLSYTVIHLSYAVSSSSCEAGTSSHYQPRPPLINAIEDYAQALGGTKIENMRDLTPGDIFIRTNWFTNAQTAEDILNGHSGIYLYYGHFTGNETLGVRATDLRTLYTEEDKMIMLSRGKSQEDDFNIIQYNPKVPQVKYPYIYHGYHQIEWDSKFTRDSAFVYKLNVTEPQLDTAIAAEMSRIKETLPTYGITYNCHDVVCNILQNLKYPE